MNIFPDEKTDDKIIKNDSLPQTLNGFYGYRKWLNSTPQQF